MRFVNAFIIVSALIVAMAVAGCSSTNNATNGNNTTATATPLPQGSLPTTPGQMTDMKYLWDHVHYLHQTTYITSTIPDMNGQESTMTWKLSDSTYKGQPAKLLNISAGSAEDQTEVNNSFSFNMGFDIYFNRAGDILTMLGGYAYIGFGNDPSEVMKGEINISQLVEQSRISGYIDPETDEVISVTGEPKFSPTIDLSEPIKPITDPTSAETTTEGSYDMNKLMSAGSAEYQGFGNVTFTPAGQETVKIGNRDFICHKYTWSVVQGNPDWGGQYTTVYTAWYSPEFPAQPLKTVADMNNGQTVQTTVVDEWN